MAKGQQKQVFGTAGKQIGTAQQQEQQFLSSLAPQTAGYTNFATTGGISPQTQQEIQQRESSSLASLYGNLQNQLSQQKAVQGGYSPGYGAQEAQLGRQTGEQIAEGRRDTDIALQQLISSGKLAGLAGLGQVSGEQLASMGLTNQDIAAMLGIQGTMALQPGLFGNLMTLLGRGGQAASGSGQLLAGLAAAGG